jgi:hypothetical protein
VMALNYVLRMRRLPASPSFERPADVL